MAAGDVLDELLVDEQDGGSRSSANGHQDGVDYTAAVTFNLHQTLCRGEVTTAVTNGTGEGSDGSQVRLHYVQHLTIDADGNVIRSFDRGSRNAADQPRRAKVE